MYARQCDAWGHRGPSAFKRRTSTTSATMPFWSTPKGKACSRPISELQPRPPVEPWDLYSQSVNANMCCVTSYWVQLTSPQMMSFETIFSICSKEGLWVLTVEFKHDCILTSNNETRISRWIHLSLWGSMNKQLMFCAVFFFCNRAHWMKWLIDYSTTFFCLAATFTSLVDGTWDEQFIPNWKPNWPLLPHHFNFH